MALTLLADARSELKLVSDEQFCHPLLKLLTLLEFTKGNSNKEKQSLHAWLNVSDALVLIKGNDVIDWQELKAS